MPKATAWFRAVRPEYLPIVLLMFGAGAAAGALDARTFDTVRALLALGCLALIQLAAMLTGEHFDYPGDILNRHAGRFSGGSRVLVTGALSHDEVLRGVVVAVALLGAASGWLLALSPHDIRIPLMVTVTLGLALALGHTAPPARLSHRGFGEINAAFMHGIYPVLLGWVVMGAAASDPLPWLVGMPAFCAMFAARTVAAIPDIHPDAGANRRTYALVFGARGAAVIASVAVLAAVVGGVLLWGDRIVSGHYGMAYLLTIPHAAVLVWQIALAARRDEADPRMDGVIVSALMFALWFGLIPFAYFVHLVRA